MTCFREVEAGILVEWPGGCIDMHYAESLCALSTPLPCFSKIPQWVATQWGSPTKCGRQELAVARFLFTAWAIQCPCPRS